jgi:Domain of unknown function (DUF4157)
LNQRAHKNRERTANHDTHLETPSPGQPLEVNVRALLEPRFAHSFANVRVHADRAADELTRTHEARAFAFGNDLYFRDGAYDPTSSQGLHTLAHELTHVVQQSGATKSTRRSSQSEDRTELEAGSAARDVMQGRSVNVQAGSADQVQVARMDEGDQWAAAVPPMLPPPMPGAPAPQIPGPGRVPTNIPGLPEVSPGPNPGRIGLLGGLGAGIAGVAAGLAAWLWPNKTAPRWMDEMNPLTGQPYASEQEFQQVQQELQRRALEEQNAGTPSAS